jgi:hypothetical protein
MKLLGLVILVSAIACGGSNKTSEPAKAAPAAAEMTPPVETAPASGATPTAAADTAPINIPEPPPESTAGPTGPASSKIKGCAAANMTAKSKPAHPEGAESLDVKANGSTIVATHVIAHSCGLKGEVTTEADGTAVVIHEKLVGKAFKCRCGTTIETKQPVSPGTYDVRVVVEEPGDTSRDAGTNQVTVQ